MFVFQQLRALLEHSTNKNLLLVLRVLKAHIRKKKDNKAVNHASTEKQPREEEPFQAKTVTSTRVTMIVISQQVTLYDNVIIYSTYTYL